MQIIYRLLENVVYLWMFQVMKISHQKEVDCTKIICTRIVLMFLHEFNLLRGLGWVDEINTNPKIFGFGDN